MTQTDDRHTTVDLSAYPISEATAHRLRTMTIGHVIDGVVVGPGSSGTLPVYDPSTGRAVASMAVAGPSEVEAAIASARQAFEDGRWQFLDPLDKERRLRELSRLIAVHAEELAELDVIDGGILRVYSGFIAKFAVDGVDYYSGWPTKLQGSIPATPGDIVVRATREPVGVVGLIMPWNGPSAVVVAVAAALAAGNSVILKPAEQTPITAVRLAELALEAGIPPGVFNVLQGTGDVAGAGLVAHPDVDTIAFTGSVDTGRRIQAAAAARVKRVSLELGGKSAHIVFEDADLDAAADATAAAVWGNSGQVCTAGSRVLVQRSVHDRLLERIIDRSKGLTIGNAFDPTAQIGPLISADQLDRVAGYVTIGRDEGAELVLGGSRIGDAGYFHEPTIFAGVDNSMRIAREEIFGPVMSVIPFDSEDDAVRVANDSEFGLAAGVWTQDVSRAHRVPRRLKAGTVWVNTYQAVYPSVPYGGVKQSGHGRNLGAESLDDFLQTKSVWTRIGAEP
ncbi:aldehyde dehydrogenase family protein [Desertimonas flava]|uniref:aldehyde dehydrogenase family protein n=1 Tax=Desertimonas flava TaxID=2064846 RepID=UPI000E3509D2|nr:aldehyde dehydrogenase family protein [Desertimonas flava]